MDQDVGLLDRQITTLGELDRHALQPAAGDARESADPALGDRDVRRPVTRWKVFQRPGRGHLPRPVPAHPYAVPADGLDWREHLEWLPAGFRRTGTRPGVRDGCPRGTVRRSRRWSPPAPGRARPNRSCCPSSTTAPGPPPGAGRRQGDPAVPDERARHRPGADRLSDRLQDPALAGVTAGLYIGDIAGDRVPRCSPGARSAGLGRTS